MRNQHTDSVHSLEQNAEIVKLAAPGGIINSGVVGPEIATAAARCNGGIFVQENNIPELSITPALFIAIKIDLQVYSAL